MKVNLNAGIKIKLTPTGASILKDHYEKLLDASDAKDRIEKMTDAEGLTNIRLWEFMRIFGPYMNLGIVDVPFEENAFHIVDMI